MPDTQMDTKIPLRVVYPSLPYGGGPPPLRVAPLPHAWRPLPLSEIFESSLCEWGYLRAFCPRAHRMGFVEWRKSAGVAPQSQPRGSGRAIKKYQTIPKKNNQKKNQN